MIILGIDPGPTKTAYCILEFSTRDGPPTFIDSGISESSLIVQLLAYLTTHYKIDLVALEKPEGQIYARYRAKHILETCFVAGDIHRIVLNYKLPIRHVAAPIWRKLTVGKGAAKDPAIKQWILSHIPSWPNRSSNHTRDAAGCAYGAHLLLNK